MTNLQENILKAVFHLTESDTHLVATSAVAQELGVSKSTSTETLQELSKKGMVEYHPYQGVRLTKKGSQTALQIIRIHRLWEVFLVEKLGFNWDEVHELAEELEHIRSEKFIDHLDDFLGNPKEDPHGDPIPSKSGILTKSRKKTLTEFKVGERGKLSQVSDDSDAFLNYIVKYGIQMGSVFEVCAIEAYDGSYDVQIDEIRHQLSRQVAEQLKLIKID